VNFSILSSHKLRKEVIRMKEVVKKLLTSKKLRTVKALSVLAVVGDVAYGPWA
jgi:hypothetical protein